MSPRELPQRLRARLLTIMASLTGLLSMILAPFWSSFVNSIIVPCSAVSALESDVSCQHDRSTEFALTGLLTFGQFVAVGILIACASQVNRDAWPPRVFHIAAVLSVFPLVLASLAFSSLDLEVSSSFRTSMLFVWLSVIASAVALMLELAGRSRLAGLVVIGSAVSIIAATATQVYIVPSSILMFSSCILWMYRIFAHHR